MLLKLDWAELDWKLPILRLTHSSLYWYETVCILCSLKLSSSNSTVVCNGMLFSLWRLLTARWKNLIKESQLHVVYLSLRICDIKSAFTINVVLLWYTGRRDRGVGTLGSKSFPTCLPLMLAFQGPGEVMSSLLSILKYVDGYFNIGCWYD